MPVLVINKPNEMNVNEQTNKSAENANKENINLPNIDSVPPVSVSNEINNSQQSPTQNDSNVSQQEIDHMVELTLNETQESAQQSTECVKKEPVFQVMNDHDADVAENVFNDSYEICGSDDELMIKINDQLPKPMAEKNKYQVKVDDVLSGTMPFAVNDKFDRSYIASFDSDWKEITLPCRIVRGLITFNTPENRDKIEIDSKFIKVLIVACFGMKKVRAETSDPISKAFVKGNIIQYFIAN